jgi:hypothetical protein
MQPLLSKDLKLIINNQNINYLYLNSRYYFNTLFNRKFKLFKNTYITKTLRKYF